MTPNELLAEIRTLRSAIDPLFGDAIHTKEAWTAIAAINAQFKATRFATRAEHDAAWAEHQEVVSLLKRRGKERQAQFEDFTRESERHLSHLLDVARNAAPLSLLERGIATIAFPPFAIGDAITEDPLKKELDEFSQALRDGFAYHSEHKNVMTRAHRDEAWSALRATQEKLDAAWAKWRDSRREAHEERSRQFAARREESAERQRAFRERVEQEIAELETKIEHAEEFSDKMEQQIAQLRERLDNTRNDAKRDEIEGWIREAEDKRSSASERIERYRSWITEKREKLAR